MYILLNRKNINYKRNLNNFWYFFFIFFLYVDYGVEDSEVLWIGLDN